MTLSEYVTLTELLKDFRNEVDTDLAAKIEKAGMAGGSVKIFLAGKEVLTQIDAIIEMVGTYQLNAPVDAGIDEAEAMFNQHQQTKAAMQ